jgi:hypothetical protein
MSALPTLPEWVIKTKIFGISMLLLDVFDTFFHYSPSEIATHGLQVRESRRVIHSRTIHKIMRTFAAVFNT